MWPFAAPSSRTGAKRRHFFDAVLAPLSHSILAVLLSAVKHFFYKIENSALNAVHIDA
jgi:hypothetical protein